MVDPAVYFDLGNGIREGLKRLCKAAGLDFKEVKGQLQQLHQWFRSVICVSLRFSQFGVEISQSLDLPLIAHDNVARN